MRVGAALLGAGLLSACQIFDDDKDRPHPVEPLPAAFSNNDAAAVELPAPRSDWWRSFQSEELDRLVTTALERNHNLKIAIARVVQADAQGAAAGAALFPTLDAKLGHATTGPAGGIGTAGNGVPWKSDRVIQGGLRASYEFDLWGKNGYAADSALALAKASVHSREVVAVTLVADLTKSYIDYLAESDHLAVATDNLENARVTLKAVRTRMERGDGQAIEVMQQETAVATVEANVQNHRLLRAKAFNQIAALLGLSPGELSLTGSTLTTLTLPTVAPGIPSRLICRRPDIRQAEATLMAADADINVARAKMYPSLTFSAEGGRGAMSFANLLSPQSAFYSIVGQLTQSIFDAGKNASAVRQSKGRYVEMVEAYRQVIIEAMHDVEDALVTLKISADQQRALMMAVEHAGKAYDLSTRSFQRGAIEYTTLLETQRTLYGAKDSEAGIRADRLKASVDLFKALGGGLDDPQC
jgi:NodT family efflux transporter outer membrane factor (OMF) lipoprotein